MIPTGFLRFLALQAVSKTRQQANIWLGFGRMIWSDPCYGFYQHQNQSISDLVP
jgi:hypothetical protein